MARLWLSLFSAGLMSCGFNLGIVPSQRDKVSGMKTMIKLMSVLVVFILFAVSAYAIPTLVLNSGTTTVTVTDNGSGDSNGGSGTVVYSGTVGNWLLTITTGVAGGNPTLEVNSQDVAGGSPDPLTITFSDPAQLVTGPNNFGAGLSSTTIGLPGGTVTYNVLVDGSTAATISGSGSATGSLSSGSHTVAEQVIVAGSGAGTASFDASLTVPDAGTTVVLLGVSLTALGVFGCSRKFVPR